ncbi:hypothetical protein J6590_031485 [Homalodisca vitripennis]|nr:hypothetical protein J6590_031485 [Homalodisca vitripennis]
MERFQSLITLVNQTNPKERYLTFKNHNFQCPELGVIHMPGSQRFEPPRDWKPSMAGATSSLDVSKNS